MDNYQAVFKRKEIKYLLSEEKLTAMMPAIKAHMEPDEFAHSSISNLYYDTPDFRMVRRSMEKPQYKEKLRLRSYSSPKECGKVFPEIKKKAEGIVYKRRVCMEYEEATEYLHGKSRSPSGQIFRELDWIISSYNSLAPRVFMSYERDSWKGKEDSNLRLTLDRDILWRTVALDLREEKWGEKLLRQGQVLMEIKAANAVPVWLAHLLSDNNIFPVSFSKYGRAFEGIYKENIRLKETGYNA